jgi:single-stranded-DNA-specific exonuclease
MELDRLNNLRKETEKKAVEDIGDIEDKFIVVEGEYNEGVVGIIASRLVHKYRRPAIVFSRKEGILKGSGRSLGNIDIFSIVNECSDLLEGFGGHKMACGLSIKEENFEKFKEKLNILIETFEDEDFFIEDYVLGELPFSEIDFELIEILNAFEPYGEGNPKPKFKASAKVEHIQNLKDNHFKLILSQDDIFIPALLFRYDDEIDDFISFKFTLTVNEYYGKNIELLIEEIL